MNKITHPLYQNYPEQPYISPERDLTAWGADPESFPYGLVEKRNMVRLPEGILPGHIVMLWRVHFNTFTTETVIPQYFEYRYGVDSRECLQTLQNLGFIRLASATESLSVLTIKDLKPILKAHGLRATGTKPELVNRLTAAIPDKDLAKNFILR